MSLTSEEILSVNFRTPDELIRNIFIYIHDRLMWTLRPLERIMFLTHAIDLVLNLPIRAKCSRS